MAVISLTDATFDSEVLRAEGPVLVDFWASWCGPCKVLRPIIEELAREVTGVKFGALNVDLNAATAGRYGIMSIPTLLIFKDGEVVEQLVGMQSKEKLKAKLALLE